MSLYRDVFKACNDLDHNIDTVYLQEDHET